MERPEKSDYDFNDVFEGVRFATYMIRYTDHIEALLKEYNSRVLELENVLGEYNHVTVSTLCSFKPNTIGFNDLTWIRDKASAILRDKQ